MRVDHVSYAAESDGAVATAHRIAERLGLRAFNGGVQPTFGTRNVVIPLSHERYIEVVEPLDHPVTDKVPFGQAVKAACESGGGWMSWVVRVPDMAAFEERLGRTARPCHRVFPDGRRLEWLQLGTNGMRADPQLPYFVEFTTPELHASGATQEPLSVNIQKLTIAGDPNRVRDWIGTEPWNTSSVIEFDFVAPHGHAGLLSVGFHTPQGDVTI